MTHRAPNLFGAGPVLPVSDVFAAVEYYREILGFAEDLLWGDPPTHGSVTRCRVGIQFTKVSPVQAAQAYAGWTFIFVEEIDQLFAEYRANGVVVTQELTSHTHGMREFEIQDLNGHRLRFGQYLEG